MAALLARSSGTTLQSIVSKSSIGSISLLSSAAAVAPIAIPKRVDDHQLGRFLPTSVLPKPNKHVNNTESLILRTAIQDLNKEKKNIISLEKMLETLRIARVLPTKRTTTTSSPVVLPPKQQPDEQQQHTFQAMNRNARKAKRANHGKRPCSRIRRRYKVKKWANTSRRG